MDKTYEPIVNQIVYKIMYMDSKNKVTETNGTYHRAVAILENDKLHVISIQRYIG